MVAVEVLAPVAGKRKKVQLLSRGFRKGLATLTREYGHEFSGKPRLKEVAVGFFRALLQPHRRPGRKCDQNVTTASRLLKTYRRRYPTEPYSETWNRIYPVAIPGLDALPRRQASREKRRLRDAVRSRSYSRRRSKAK